jgi:hypothetical protein
MCSCHCGVQGHVKGWAHWQGAMPSALILVPAGVNAFGWAAWQYLTSEAASGTPAAAQQLDELAISMSVKLQGTAPSLRRKRCPCMKSSAHPAIYRRGPQNCILYRAGGQAQLLRADDTTTVAGTIATHHVQDAAGGSV